MSAEPGAPDRRVAQTGSLISLLEEFYKTRDLASIKPMAMNGMLRGHDFARHKVITRRIAFDGSAARFKLWAASSPDGCIKASLLDIIGPEAFEVATRPSANPKADLSLGVTPSMYDRDRVLVTGMSIRAPTNSLPIGVALGTNGLPPVYAKLSREQIEAMTTEMGLPKRDEHLILHIPAGQVDEDTGIVQHLLKENVNSHHGEELCKTYGGLTAAHLYRGIIPLSPERAMAFGMKAPPPEHDGKVNPDNPKETYVNSWNIVPMGHVLSHIQSQTSAYIKSMGYEVHQLVTATDQVLPFLIMDTWTIYAYTRWTIKEVMLNMAPVPLQNVDVRVYPLKTSDWLSGCRPLEHCVDGRIEFTLTVGYVMFPKDFKSRPDILPGLSPRFPSMSAETLREFEGRGQGQITRLLQPQAMKRSNMDDTGEAQAMDQDD